MGYRVVNKKLVIEEKEAEIVREIFRRFLEIQSPKAIANELNINGIWTNSGRIWNTMLIYYLLNNHHYIGEVLYKGQVYPGEHKAIIDRETWDLTQRFLSNNAPKRDGTRKMELAASLRGILRCGHCNGAMTPVRSKRWGREHHYYRCITDAKRDVSICPIRSVNAGEIEQIVIAELKKILVAPEIVLAMAKSTGERPKDIIEMFSEKLWDEISPIERQRLMQLLTERVTINEKDIKIEIRTAGIKSILEEHRGE